MKIRFLEDTYIRPNLGVPIAEPIGVIYRDTELEVEDRFHIGPFAIQNNDRWYRDRNGWYYWSGETEIVARSPMIGEDKPIDVAGPAVPDVPAKPVAPEPIPDQPAPIPVPPDVPPTPTPDVPPVPTPDPPVENPPAPEPPAEVPEPSRPTSPLEDQPLVAIFPIDPDEFDLSFEVFAGEIGIPEGETRAVARLHGEEDTALVEETSAAKHIHAAPESIRSSVTQEINPQALNWALQQHSIPKDWWQASGLTGAGVTIALLSTGADLTHPDLDTAIHGVFTTLEDAGETMEDAYGLGTQAAVLAGGRGAIAYGVAPEARFLFGQIGRFDRDVTPMSLASGIDWALSKQADIIALLVDFRSLNDAEKDAIEHRVRRAAATNVWMVAPVGNSIERRPEDRFPAAFNEILSVGAHNIYEKRCAFSAKSYLLDLMAPGEGLLTSNPQREAVQNMKNTSLAAAYMAGLLALIRQWQREHHKTMDYRELFNLLRQTARPDDPLTKGDDVEYGHGIVNPKGILSQLFA